MNQQEINANPVTTPTPEGKVENNKQIVIEENHTMQNDEDPFKTTPFIPDEVYNNLPPFLKELTDLFSDRRERDVVLVSVLVILSGCFTACSGKYDRNTVRTNLYGFIVAPAASGKHLMAYAPLLADRPPSKIKNTTPKDDQKNVLELPSLFVPGNTSAAAMYDILNEHEGVGIICETEADSLSGAIKQDWGNFSELLRKAFHHEVVSILRKTSKVHIRLQNPCLSILLSGTPDQVSRLIKSPEDGLCSRFLFYTYKRDAKWNDITPCDECPDLKEVFMNKGAYVHELRSKLEGCNFTFTLTPTQFEMLNDHFSKKVDKVAQFEGEEAMSCIYRLGLIAYRISMILSILRGIESSSVTKKITCMDQDFNSALRMVDVFFEHAMKVYGILPRKGINGMLPDMRRLYEILPQDVVFRTKIATDLGKTNIGLCPRTVGSHLSKLVNMGFLKYISHGKYKKINITVERKALTD
jgi:hypothetical protein